MSITREEWEWDVKIVDNVEKEGGIGELVRTKQNALIPGCRHWRWAIRI